MASKVEPRMETGTFQDWGHSTPGHAATECHRCGGLMVREFCTDLLSSTGELDFVSCRCVQCGEVVDPVILQNRKRQQEMMLRKGVQVAVQAFGSQEGDFHPSPRRIPRSLTMGNMPQ